MAITAMSGAAIAASCSNSGNQGQQQPTEQQLPDDKQRPQQPPKQMTADERTEQMVNKLGLDEAQAAQLKELNNNYADAFKGPGGGRPPKMDEGNKGEKPAGPEQMTDEQKKEMEQMMAKRAEYETKLKAILTDEQYKNYQQMQPKRGHGGPRPK